MRVRPSLLFSAALAAACADGPTEGHPWLTDPGVEGHAPYLLLANTPHDPSVPGALVSCNDCHPGDSFRTFECVACHTPATMDPRHASVAEYPAGGVVTSADCYRCHPKGIGITPANHARFFPIETVSHPAVCTQCHTDPVNRQDPALLACATCHAQHPGFSVAHALVRDYPLAPTPEWCLRCHADGQVDRIASHGMLPGPWGDAGPGDGTHGTYCFECHTMVPPLPLFGGPGPGIAGRPWAQDWLIATCTNCH